MQSRTSRLVSLFTKALAIVGFAAYAASATSLIGQGSSAPTKVLDSSALHPPAGANVAIVEFSDLQCPACARANQILKDASAKYKLPWIRHDMLIPTHNWSRSAAVYARWFDEKGKGLGDAYRDAVFASQPSIYNVNMLTEFTQNFARSHSIALPFAVDPQNKLSQAVQADSDLGKRTGIMHTPSIFIVTAHSKGAPFLEVQNPERDLYQMIDQALADTKAAAEPVRRARSR